MSFEPVVLIFVLGVVARTACSIESVLLTHPSRRGDAVRSRLLGAHADDAQTRNGITTYCLSLDPTAGQYVSRIFGAKNYMVVDHVQRLPEKFPLLYMGLTR